MFSLYVREIENIASFHNVSVHINADDIQCYFSFSKDVLLCVVNDRIRAFVNDIKRWMDSNHLMLNQLKTKYIESTPSRSVGNKVISDLQLVNSEKLVPCTSVKNLGVLFDDKLLFDITSIKLLVFVPVIYETLVELPPNYLYH